MSKVSHISTDARKETAIKYLALPDHGGLTLKEIAEECGVSVRQLHNWRNEESFQKKLHRTVIKYSREHFSEVTDAVKEGAVSGNAAMARLWYQVHGYISSNGNTLDVPEELNTADLEKMQERIDEYKRNRLEA